ncbi:Ubiquitin-like protein 3 [Liparis tanakae]|uniref:Ubiquitin-like protein 3 n=1 Tax=Liparis tanakae TaxID=230148 RepID=A0A4Z2G176_9TELE|nr:Ubiquitin-like protein 3 [Liparis tanakae]
MTSLGGGESEVSSTSRLEGTGWKAEKLDPRGSRVEAEGSGVGGAGGAVLGLAPPCCSVSSVRPSIRSSSSIRVSVSVGVKLLAEYLPSSPSSGRLSSSSCPGAMGDRRPLRVLALELVRGRKVVHMSESSRLPRGDGLPLLTPHLGNCWDELGLSAPAGPAPPSPCRAPPAPPRPAAPACFLVCLALMRLFSSLLLLGSLQALVNEVAQSKAGDLVWINSLDWNALHSLLKVASWLRSGKTQDFTFSPNDSATDIAKHVFENWPEGWEEERVSSPSILRLIFQGRFLHGNVTLGALKLPPGRTTVMHLVARETLPEPNSHGERLVFVSSSSRVFSGLEAVGCGSTCGCTLCLSHMAAGSIRVPMNSGGQSTLQKNEMKTSLEEATREPTEDVWNEMKTSLVAVSLFESHVWVLMEWMGELDLFYVVYLIQVKVEHEYIVSLVSKGPLGVQGSVNRLRHDLKLHAEGLEKYLETV